ncbi:MAG: preprotein translocase subunit SecY [Gammaproteobacteria bacterium]|nr:preprotein translocase subunit SecY [Gammaproteobacteria bacterium]MYD76952.1 preprotein translocase subunit SecY [Gammaproteobacteria bacterium]
MAKTKTDKKGAPNPGMFGSLSDLKQRILFMIGALMVFRLGTHVPVPGVDPAAVAALFEQTRGSIIDIFNMFSGGALSRLSIFALGVMPYISASIIMQMMKAVIPSLEQLNKEGEAGRRKITQYTRYFTVVLALFQGIGISVAIESQQVAGSPVILIPGIGFKIIAASTLCAGTMFLVWLGEQVSERGLGNGISLIIFASIVAGLPSAVAGTLELARTGALSGGIVLLLFIGALAVTYFVVFVERGQRRITVNYAKRQQGRRMIAGQSSHLPFKLNMAGVIPPIFASSLILFPASLGSWFGQAETMGWMTDIATKLQPGEPIYTFLYGGMIIFFCFFYTALVFNPNDIADNLKKSGAFIPGIRPGAQSARYIDGVVSRLTMIGAIYITFVCLIPEFLIVQYSVPFYFGGTSLLIIVVVTMDLIAQVQSYLMSRQYENIMKKSPFSRPQGIR